MIFKASRLSDGNKIFPVEVELKETCLEIKEPGLFNSVEVNYDYQFIENLKVNNRMIGYCSFSFDYRGKQIDVHGFTDEDMDEIERILDIKKKDYISSRNSSKI
jgi:hypothetical protein